MNPLFNYYRGIVFKNKWLIFGIFLLVNGVALLGVLVQRPIYEARMRLVYNPQLSQGAFSAQSLFSQNSEVNNQIEILKSFALAQDTQSLWLKKNPAFNLQPEQIAENIDAHAVENTSLIEVTYRNTSHVSAIEGLQLFLAAYQKKDREIYHQNLESTRKVLDDYIAQLEKKLIKLGNDLARYKKDATVVANSQAVYTQMLDWQKTKQEHEYLSNSAQQQLHEMHQYLNGQVDLVKIYKRVDQHPIIYKLLKDKERAQSSGASVTRLRDMQIGINKNILKIVSQKKSAWYDQYHRYLTEYFDARNEYDSRRAKYNALADIIARYGKMLEQGSPRVWQYNKLDRTNEVNLGVYAALLKQREELEIQRANDPGNIRVVEKPNASNVPIFPKVKQSLSLSLVLSLILAVGAVVGLEIINPTLGNISQIQSILKLKAFADLSMFGRDPIITNADDDSSYAQTVRKLRIYMNSLLPSEKKSLAIGVVRFQEGLHAVANSVAYNLGAFVAYTGQSTLLVETDPKNPSLWKYFAPTQGHRMHLSHVLKSKTVPEKVIRKTSIPEYSILNLEVEEMHSADIWEIPNVRNWIKLLKKDYHTQLILTPPANLVPYALSLLDYFDKIILEIPSGFRDVAAIEEFKAVALKKEIEILGAYLV